MKINESPTVSNGVGASSFRFNCKSGSVTHCGHPNKLTQLHLWRFKLEILQSQNPQTWHSDADISDVGFFYAFIFVWKNKTKKTLGYTRILYSQTGKNTNWAETFVWCLLLIFKVVYQDHLTVTSLRTGFHSEKAAAGLGPSGLTTQTSFCHHVQVSTIEGLFIFSLHPFS